MTNTIDLNAILAPIPGAEPTGEDLRYTAVYDGIREARRADDPIPQGEWQREVKCSDWGRVASTSLAALSGRSKDLQIAAWLAEALTATEGFAGLASGLSLLAGLIGTFWDDIYPRIEDDDYDYRVAPLEFLNDKLAASVRRIPLTDPRGTPGYSHLKWQESREVGYESEARRGQRELMLAEGKLPAEGFDAAVASSSAAFYQTLADAIAGSLASSQVLDAEVDRNYGVHAPRLSDLGQALEDCQRLVLKVCREQKGLTGVPDAQAPAQVPGPGASGALPAQGRATAEPVAPGRPASASPAASFSFPLPSGSDESQETPIWNEALRIMQERGFKEALNLLLAAASSQSSERGRSRYRFLVARLCLKGGRPELARPIVEQLNTMITELQLEKWECPFWISGIYQALHQCLSSGEAQGEEAQRAQELFRKICTMDVTKALDSRS
jgi:type VI secretion system protein ImpA